MGLDMYLEAEKFLWNKDPLIEQIQNLLNGPIATMEPKTVVFEAMYWRKVNSIHGWFVENVQNGEDDCGRHYVSKEQLKKLLSVCTEVVKIALSENSNKIEEMEKIKEILPTVPGFFFGSTDYDSYFLADIKETADKLKLILNSKTVDDFSFYYHSSW